MAGFLSVTTKFNRIARVIDILTPSAEWCVNQLARDIEVLWSQDVRVSPGRGNWYGNHYRDIIEAYPVDEADKEISGEPEWRVDAPNDYAFWNEFGGPYISARPSARDAAEQGVADAAGFLGEVVESIYRAAK